MSWVCLWRKRECLVSWGRLFQIWGPKCEKVRKPWVLSLNRRVWACVCLMKSKDCKGVVAQKDKRERNLWLHCNTCKQFCILFVQKLGASGVAVGEVCSFDGMVLWERGLQQYFGLYTGKSSHFTGKSSDSGHCFSLMVPLKTASGSPGPLNTQCQGALVFFPETLDLPCFPFCTAVFLHLKSLVSKLMVNCV